MECFSDTALTGCYSFWTAGQGIDPAASYSQYIWRVTSTDTYNDTVYAMPYTNWRYRLYPRYNWYAYNFDRARPPSGMCVYFHIRMPIDYYDYFKYGSYEWWAGDCDGALCSVCEIDV